jgi:multidrug efflux pump subunit AcrA (membrane-fusion protein)
MNVTINRLDPNVPDPVESRRRAAGRFVRIAYATIVFGVLAFFVIYFGAPFVYLGGPGTVSSPRHVVSLPYTVQVSYMNLLPGATVKAGDEIAEVLSPEQDSIVATYMRALADITGRTAELRIKARAARDSLEAARSYMRVAEEAAEHVGGMSAATVTFRMEVLRERASARKAVASQEAEVAESDIQLASLDEFIQQLRGRLDEVERHFGRGRVLAPIAGIVSTGLADVGQSLVAGTPIAEVLDPTDIFVDWYIPNVRLIDPTVGNEVSVLFGNRRIPGKISQILPVSGVYAGSQQLLTRDRLATQIARIRFDPDALPPPLNSSVDVRMHYTELSARVANVLVRLFGLY